MYETVNTLKRKAGLSPRSGIRDGQESWKEIKEEGTWELPNHQKQSEGPVRQQPHRVLGSRFLISQEEDHFLLHFLDDGQCLYNLPGIMSNGGGVGGGN